MTRADLIALAARFGWRYLGPCHTPAEVAALVAAARREGAEAMREAAASHALKYRWRTGPADVIAAAIRALPLPAAADQIGIPAATLAGLRDGSLVAVPGAWMHPQNARELAAALGRLNGMMQSLVLGDPRQSVRVGPDAQEDQP